MAWLPDRSLLFGMGDGNLERTDAQRLHTHHGKVVRITDDGGVPDDNPFAKRPGALPEIWSYGHRNPQGATIGPDGKLWMHEHGPQGGDEINLPRPAPTSAGPSPPVAWTTPMPASAPTAASQASPRRLRNGPPPSRRPGWRGTTARCSLPGAAACWWPRWCCVPGYR